MMADNAYKFSRSYSNDYAEANLIHMPTNNTTKSLLRYVRNSLLSGCDIRQNAQ